MNPTTSLRAAFVTLLCACAALAGPVANAAGSEPILTLDELQERLGAERDAGSGDAVGQALRLGPGYAWLLADLLQRDDAPALAARVCRGLARNGDAESLSVLREAVADTGRPAAVRERAVSALADARDRESLPLLFEVSTDGSDRVLAAAAGEAIRRIESPGFYRPLIEVENGVLFFGFLLDDLESIEYAEASGARHSFSPAEFRQICDLLQGGTVADATGTSMAGTLTFRLKDGATRDVRTDGTVYGNISGQSMESPALGEFIMSRLGR